MSKRRDDADVTTAGERKPSRVPAVVVALVTLLAMGRLCAMDWTQWDDDLTIHHNPHLNPPTLAGVGYSWTHPHMGLYVPVTYTAWSGLAAIAYVSEPDERGIHLNPWVFHTANVGIHVVNALLVYRILQLLVRRPWPAAMGAILFGVHPVQVETVGWISGGKDLLCGLFVLGAVWQYLLHCRLRIADCGLEERDLASSIRNPKSKIRNWHRWIGLACMVAGMLCKPTAVVTPLLLIALDRWAIGRSWHEVIRSVWPFAAAAVPCLVWTKWVQTVAPFVGFWPRPLLAMDALAFYLGKIVWPARLAVDYEHSPRVVMRGSAWLVTWLVPALVAALVWLGRQSRPMLVAAGVIFIAALLPLLGLTPFMYQLYSTTADHYLYLPMLGAALAAAWVLARWPTRGVAMSAGVLLAILAIRSAVQAGVWADDVTLNQHAVDVTPGSFAAHANLAAALEFQAIRENDRAKLDEAIQHLRLAIAANPDAFLSYQNLGSILYRQGKFEEALALLKEGLAAAERRPPEDITQLAEAHVALGLLLKKQGRHDEAVTAVSAGAAN